LSVHESIGDHPIRARLAEHLRSRVSIQVRAGSNRIWSDVPKSTHNRQTPCAASVGEQTDLCRTFGSGFVFARITERKNLTWRSTR